MRCVAVAFPVLCLSLVLCSPYLFAQLPAADAAWSMDAGGGTQVLDDSGNERDGTMESGCTWETAGQYAKCIRFDGVAGDINLGGIDFSGQQLSITGWFKADDFGVSDARLVSKANGVSGSDHWWMVSTLQVNGKYWLRFRLKTANGVTSTLVQNETVGTDLQPGDWTHFAAVFDGGTGAEYMKLYKDGVEVGSTFKKGSLATDATIEAWIGDNPGGGRCFDGLIDNVRIYDVALSQAQVDEDRTTEILSIASPSPPAAPSNLQPAVISFQQIDLSWTDNATDENSQQIYRSTSGSGGPFSFLTSVAANSTSYSDLGISSSTEYCYRVRAINENGPSGYSNIGCDTTPPATPPTAPSNLTTTAATPSQINLSWADNSSNEDGFEVYRSTPNESAYQPIHTSAANETSYNDTGLTAATVYWYKIRAINSAGVSAYSNSASATTLPVEDVTAAYALDESAGTVAFDAGPSGYNGTLSSGGTWLPTGGYYGGGADFDGSTGHVDLGGIDVPGTELTITAWFKVDTWEHEDRIVAKSNGGTDYWAICYAAI